MLARAKKIEALIASLSVMALAVAAVLLPIDSLAATSPSVAVLSPLVQGLDAPVKSALDASGNIYVADRLNRGVVKFNTYGVQVLKISTAAAPTAIAFAQDGTLLVGQSTFVARYNPANGEEVGRLVGGQLQVSAGIAVDDVTGYIYVTDSRANQVEVYTASGNYVKAFAKGVRADASGATVLNPLGKLSMPKGISFEKISRQFAVADTLSNRVQFFDVDGNFVKSIGNPLSTVLGASAGPMQFVSPVAVAFEYSKDPVPVLSRMYVVDSYMGNVQVIDPAGAGSALNVAGTASNYIGSVGMANGQLQNPSDAVFDAVNSRLLVVNGFGNVTIYGIDGGKNPSDTTPPALTVNPLPVKVSVSAITVSGTVEAGATVIVTVAAPTVAGVVAYPTPTTWKSDITGLVAGNNTITVTARDTAGNTTPPQTVSTTYQLPAPAMTVSAAPGLTNERNFVLSGTVEDGATVKVTNDTTSVTGAAAVTGTNWTYKVSLAEGANSITVSAEKSTSDKTTAALAITLDTITPLLTVYAIADGSYTSTRVQNITGKVSDTSAYGVLVNNVQATLNLNDGSFSAPVSLVTGTNTVRVVATDLAGNATVDSRTLYFDATAPVITIASPMDNSFTNRAALQVSGTVDKTATITVAGVAATVDGSNRWSASMELVPGFNNIEVVATDLYGNTSTLKRSVTLDTVNPILSISSPAQDVATRESSVTITGTVEDNNAITLTYSANGVISSVPVDAGGFSFTVGFQNNGTYPVTITATDAAGNSTTATRSLIYDTTPPIFSIDPVLATVSVSNITVSGTVEAGASVVVTTAAPTVAGPVVYASATTWKSEITGLVPGNNTIAVTGSDVVGNTTSPQTVSTIYLFPAPVMTLSAVPELTKVRDLVLSGTVDEGAAVTVTNSTTSVSGTATVTGSAWTYSVSLAEGANSISLVAQKPMSEKATAALGLTLDTIPPALSVSALSDGSYTSTQVQNISGNVADASAVSVLVNNVPADLVGGSFSVPVSLEVGKNTVTVVAGDLAGNVTVNSRILYFDAGKPIITIDSPMDNSFTHDAFLQFTGTVNEVSTIVVSGVPAVVDSNNNWSAGIQLIAGLNTIEVVATDLYGNTSTLKRSVTLDNVKPVLAISSPVQDIATRQSSVTIKGTVNDNFATTLAYSVNGKVTPVTVTAGSFSFKVTFIKEGTYPVTITATDVAGNTTTAIRSLIYDITPPFLTLNPVNGMPKTISGTVESGAVVAVKQGSTNIGKVTVNGNNWVADLSGISYNVRKLSVVATDAAGNSTTKMVR